MIDKVKEKIICWWKNKNEFEEVYEIELLEKSRLAYRLFLKIYMAVFFGVIVLGLFIGEKHMFIMSLLFVILIAWFVVESYKRIRSKFFKRRYRPFERELQMLIIDNGYYEQDREGNLIDWLPVAYTETFDSLVVFVGKSGGKYQEVVDKLKERLESALNLPLYKKESDLKYTTYIFRKKPVEREMISELPLKDSGMELSIYDDISISLRKNYNTLISGASGGGKSVLAYGLMAKFAQQVVVKEVQGEERLVHAKLFLIDPKISDINKHAEMANFPSEYYASDISGAFKIVNRFTAELEKRKKLYSTILDFDKTMVELGHEPYLLIIDEYSSLVAQMDKKQKEDFEKKIGNIARLGRQLSMGVFIIMQQASADSSSGLPTGIREQLVNRVFMGNPSAQSAQMTFGSSVNDLPEVSEVGEGIISIDGQEPVRFLAPSFVGDINLIIQPVLKEAASNYREMEGLEIGEVNNE